MAEKLGIDDSEYDVNVTGKAAARLRFVGEHGAADAARAALSAPSPDPMCECGHAQSLHDGPEGVCGITACRCFFFASRAPSPDARAGEPSGDVEAVGMDEAINELITAGEAKVTREQCERCDGCGWYEGGKTLKTHCEECGGTGVVERLWVACEPRPDECDLCRDGHIFDDNGQHYLCGAGGKLGLVACPYRASRPSEPTTAGHEAEG